MSDRIDDTIQFPTQARDNRRRAPRRSLPAMYTGVTVHRVTDLRLETMHGHAYDLSISGARIELDESLEVGEPIAINLDLPGEAVSVFASARVVWIGEQDDDPGPRRMAVEFLDFLSDVDRKRLVRFIATPGSDIEFAAAA
jgi:hypothetical protein